MLLEGGQDNKKVNSSIPQDGSQVMCTLLRMQKLI